MQENHLLNPKEIMHRNGISRTTLRKWVRELALPILVISDKKKYATESDLKAWEESMKIGIQTPNSPI